MSDQRVRGASKLQIKRGVDGDSGGCGQLLEELHHGIILRVVRERSIPTSCSSFGLLAESSRFFYSVLHFKQCFFRSCVEKGCITPCSPRTLSLPSLYIRKLDCLFTDCLCKFAAFRVSETKMSLWTCKWKSPPGGVPLVCRRVYCPVHLFITRALGLAFGWPVWGFPLCPRCECGPAGCRGLVLFYGWALVGYDFLPSLALSSPPPSFPPLIRSPSPVSHYSIA